MRGEPKPSSTVSTRFMTRCELEPPETKTAGRGSARVSSAGAAAAAAVAPAPSAAVALLSELSEARAVRETGRLASAWPASTSESSASFESAPLVDVDGLRRPVRVLTAALPLLARKPPRPTTWLLGVSGAVPSLVGRYSFRARCGGVEDTKPPSVGFDDASAAFASDFFRERISPCMSAIIVDMMS